MLALLRAEVVRLYGDRLVSLAVFGSVGRGKPRPDSDIDVLVIAQPLPDGRMARVQEFEAVENAISPHLAAMQKKGIETRLSPVFKTPAEVRRGSLLFLDMIDDALILHDEGGFFRQYLQGFSERLNAMGARKVVRGNMWYWILKPDYKEGELFEI